jgi:hypothetical protein
MTELEQQLTDHLHRRAAAATPRCDLEGIEQGSSLGSLVELDDRRPRRPVRTIVGVAAVVALLVLVGAFTLLNDDQAVDTTPVTEATTTTTGGPSGERGSQDDPLPLGTAADVGDWNVTVLEAVEGTAAIMEANEVNHPPTDGSIYVLVGLSATYDRYGSATDDAGYLKVGYVGSDGRTYTEAECLAVTPDDLTERVAWGETATGTQCIEVPADVFGTGALFVETPIGTGDERVWWRLSLP